MPETSLLLRSDQDHVAYLTMNRPQAYNALSLDLMQALINELKLIDNQPDIHVVILRGAGKGFCAGHDLREMTASDDSRLHEETFQTCSALMLSITQLSKPVIAQVSGIATAAGCQLVASCDLAVASLDSRFATPGVNIGLFCSTPMVALTRAVAPKHAMEMLLLGDFISAERACEIGLINRAVPAQELETQTTALARQIAAKSTRAISLGKEAFHQQLTLGLNDAYKHCSEVMCCNMQTEDAQEGIDAFLNKRAPRWTGR